MHNIYSGMQKKKSSTKKSICISQVLKTQVPTNVLLWPSYQKEELLLFMKSKTHRCSESWRCTKQSLGKRLLSCCFPVSSRTNPKPNLNSFISSEIDHKHHKSILQFFFPHRPNCCSFIHLAAQEQAPGNSEDFTCKCCLWCTVALVLVLYCLLINQNLTERLLFFNKVIPVKYGSYVDRSSTTLLKCEFPFNALSTLYTNV